MFDDIVVIGRGLLGSIFSNVRFQNKVLILASGVSNSLETRVDEFAREEKLIKASIESYPDHLVVYFSSIDNGSKCIERYLQHKKDMELLVTSRARNYLIIRLPAVADFRNKNTLLSRMHNAFKTRSSFTVNTAARRKFILPGDIVKFVHAAIQEKSSNIVVDLCPDESISVEKLVKQMSIALNKPMLALEKTSINEDYFFDNSEARKLLTEQDAMFNEGYNEKCLSFFLKGCSRL